jgi:hypothetical protein
MVLLGHAGKKLVWRPPFSAAACSALADRTDEGGTLLPSSVVASLVFDASGADEHAERTRPTVTMLGLMRDHWLMR